MLNITKKVTLNGNSTINGAIASTYTASIDSSNPRKMTLSNADTGNATDAATLQETRADYAAFLQAAYDVQDSLIAEKDAE